MRSCVVAAALVLLAASPSRADLYDRYTEPVLARLVDAGQAEEVKAITAAEVEKAGGLLANSSSLLVVAKTNDGLYSKFLLQFARQKVGGEAVPIVLLERGATYKAGGGQATAAVFPLLRLYSGFRLGLEQGQVVPEKVGGDVRFVADEGDGRLEPLGKARLFIIAKHPPEVLVKAAPRIPMGDVFEPAAIAGQYRLHDDGRRAADLELKVDDQGMITGQYVSAETGRAYEVTGKVQAAPHHVAFTVKFPNSVQSFQGWVFTKNAGALAGFSESQGRTHGFYAVRRSEE